MENLRLFQFSTFNFQFICIFVPMKMNEVTRQFIRDHPEDDPAELLLHASRFQGVDMKTAIVQIVARRRIKYKLPSWHRDDRIIFPSTLSTEQCSSEITAFYKQRLVKSADWVCDLTGGLGVDSCFFARKVRRLTYVEREEGYCSAAHHNFSLLVGDAPVEIIHGDAVDLITKCEKRFRDADVFYLDPSRRGTGNKRILDINDCEPDLMKLIALLPETCRIIVKLSPMMDITQALSLIPEVREVHVVSVKNECKELLIIIDRTQPVIEVQKIYCVNFTSDNEEQSFHFCLQDERDINVPLAKSTGRYLYEPNAAVLKAGAYKSAAVRFEVEKLHASSHLYTSNQLIPSFPGRIFEIIEVIPFSSRICKTLKDSIPQANITVRNFPLTADDVRKRTRITDGGNVYLFATILSGKQKVLIKSCRV